jgi:hypothetical protein
VLFLEHGLVTAKRRTDMNIYPEELSAAAGVLLSLGFSYLPGVKEKFSALQPTQKRLVVLALLLAAALGTFALGCLRPGWLASSACSEDGAWALLRIFVVAVIANQAAFEISPRSDCPDGGPGDGQ